MTTKGDPMTEAQDILAAARARAAAYEPRRIDYDAANRLFKKQKTALTRAVIAAFKLKPENNWQESSPEHVAAQEAVVLLCKRTVEEWDADHPCNGAWPDHWSDWQRALDDTLGWRSTVRLEDLR